MKKVFKTWLAFLPWAGKPLKRLNDQMLENLYERAMLREKLTTLEAEYDQLEQRAEALVQKEWDEDEIAQAKAEQAAYEQQLKQIQNS